MNWKESKRRWREREREQKESKEIEEGKKIEAIEMK